MANTQGGRKGDSKYEPPGEDGYIFTGFAIYRKLLAHFSEN